MSAREAGHEYPAVSEERARFREREAAKITARWLYDRGLRGLIWTTISQQIDLDWPLPTERYGSEAGDE